MQAQRVTQPVTHGRVTPDSAMGHATATSMTADLAKVAKPVAKVIPGPHVLLVLAPR